MIRRKLANNAPGDGRMAQQMEIIWAQAQRLNRLIDTFVDIANIEQGDFTLKFSKVELISVLRSAVETTVARVNPSCVVEMKLPESPVWVRGDRERLEQVFSNVISNALRYSPEDSPVVITCEENKALSHVTALVSDSGPGISEDLRGAIFERFYQAEALRSGGLGVGLYLSKTIVEAHGGQIEVESERGTGTTICITLPV
jgi:two-component system sensor histidine kinase KdpD